MPEFVASIEVYFDADTSEADEFADAVADLILASDLVGITAVTSGVAPDDPLARIARAATLPDPMNHSRWGG